MFRSKRNKKLTKTEFTKTDLKSGMVIQLRDGELCLVVGQCLISNQQHILLDNISDNLDGEYGRSKDIMKVYAPIWFLGDLNDISTLHVLWERVESKEVTMAEVEAKFGCKVKIVKG